jgi:putative ABC transport system permease protein
VIGVALSALASAPKRALVLGLLGSLPVAVAAAAPAYVAAADRAVVAAEVAGAGAGESQITFSRSSGGPDHRPDDTFEVEAPTKLTAPGFQPVFGTEFDGGPVVGGEEWSWPITYRDGVCAHVTLTAGRCPTGRGEVMVGARSSTELGLRVGNVREFKQVEWVPVDSVPEAVRIGDPVNLSIVGVYRPNDRREPYWGAVTPFRRGGVIEAHYEPVFGSRATTKLFSLQVAERQSFTLVARPGALDADWAAGHPDQLRRLRAAALQMTVEMTAGTQPLMSRIQTNSATIRSLVPWLSLPIVPLCWLVILLAVASGADTRRTAMGQLAVRGVPGWRRAVIAAGPDALALLAGAPVGFLAGLAVGGLTAPGGTAFAPVPRAAWTYAAAAVGGALLAALLAYQGQLRSRAVDLLRRVPARGRWQSMVVELSVVALAVAVSFEVRSAHGPARPGLVVAAPLLFVLAGAVVFGRVTTPLARRLARRALRRGDLARALAGIELARRATPRRALTLAVLGVALLCFAALAVELGTDARDRRAAVELGGSRVLLSDTVDARAMREAVRRIDPQGRFAMAAVQMPGEGTDPPYLAVDSDRLATLAWPGTVSVGAAGALRPAQPPPLLVDGRHIEVDATATGPNVGETRLRAVLRPELGTERIVNLGRLLAGRRTYAADVSACRPACRLVAIDALFVQEHADLVVHEVRQGGPDRVVAGPDTLSVGAYWRGTRESSDATPRVTTGPDGATINLTDSVSSQRLVYTDIPGVLPVLATDATGATQPPEGWRLAIVGRGDRVPARTVATERVLPRLGSKGLIVDLDYLDRDVPIGLNGQAQVWVGPGAPPDVVDRLAAAGVPIMEDQRTPAVVQRASRSGIALATRFYLLAGGVALLLTLLGAGLVTGADRADRVAEGGMLRQQGVSAGVVAGAARRRDLWPIAAGLVAGPLLALAAWVVAGSAVPVFPDVGWPLTPAALPGPLVLLVPLAASAVALLVAVAVGSGRRLIARGYR